MQQWIGPSVPAFPRLARSDESRPVVASVTLATASIDQLSLALRDAIAKQSGVDPDTLVVLCESATHQQWLLDEIASLTRQCDEYRGDIADLHDAFRFAPGAELQRLEPFSSMPDPSDDGMGRTEAGKPTTVDLAAKIGWDWKSYDPCSDTFTTWRLAVKGDPSVDWHGDPPWRWDEIEGTLKRSRWCRPGQLPYDLRTVNAAP